MAKKKLLKIWLDKNNNVTSINSCCIEMMSSMMGAYCTVSVKDKTPKLSVSCIEFSFCPKCGADIEFEEII